MARPRSTAYRTLLKHVLARHADQGIKYDLLVNLVAATIDPVRAKRYRLSTLKRTPSETSAETIWKGQAAIARKYIDAAHRARRITYLEERDTRYVFLGDPASTSGRHARARTWEEEASALSNT